MTTDHPNQSNQDSSDMIPQVQGHASAQTGEPTSKEPVSRLLKHRLAKPIAIGGVALIILILVFTLMPGGGNGKGNIVNRTSAVLTYSVDDVGTVLLQGNKHELEDETETIMLSLNQSAAAALTDFDYSEGGVLWHLSGKNKVKVAEEVMNFYISDNGKTIAYITDYDEDYESGTLYLFDGKKSEIVDRDVYNHIFNVSPDGKSVFYLKDVDLDSDYPEMSTYVKVGKKKPERLGDNLVPLALANGGKYLYYAEIDEDDGDIADIYVKKGKTETRLRSNVPMDYFSAMFNSDYSQVILRDDGRSYLSIDGGESTAIGRANLYAPAQNIASRNWFEQTFSVYAVKDLTQTVFYSDDGDIVKITRAGDSEKVARGVGSALLTDDLKAIVYVDSRDRIVRKSLKDPNAEEQILASEARRFTMSPDAKLVYYIDDYDDLFVVKGNAQPERLASDVEWSSLSMAYDNKHVLFLTDYRNEEGTLHISKNGGKPSKLDEDVYNIVITPEGLYYAKDYSGGYFDLYYSKNLSKSEKLDQDVESMRLLMSQYTYPIGGSYDYGY